MNKKIYEHLKEHCRKEKYDFDDGDILEILQECGHELHEEIVDEHRWWDEIFKVTEIDGMLIGYYDAKSTGDLTAHESGWEFDPDLCHEVERHEETKVVVSYKPI